MPLQFLPYALAAYGGYKGYKGAKDSGASGIGRLLGAAAGAYGGYTLGSAGMSLFPQSAATKAFAASQPAFLANLPGAYNPQQAATNLSRINPLPGENIGTTSQADAIKILQEKQKEKQGGSLLDLLRKKDSDEYDPLKVSSAIAAATYGLGAFDQGPTDIYSPGYNVAYADFAAQRPGFSYIDPQTGQEKQYEKVYIPEADPNNQGAFRSGPYSMTQTRLKEGGLAQIKKFNEGGINYLPSKVSHDENDSNNYVRAHGYVEDGSGAGDKDEDTMLAQLADGEFVTRADGVLGAGIIAGANPNSIKDMREKGAQYFYNQQARYKRVFDLLKEKNGNSKQKTN
jgi:hypothetical protein